MEHSWYDIIQKTLWFGIAAVGFGVLFNVPARSLPGILIIAMAGGFSKFYLMCAFHLNIVLASLAGSVLIGILSIPAAHFKHAPPLVFAIPACIPLVPGVLAYRMMLGLIKLAGEMNQEDFVHVLAETITNGMKVMFVLVSLALGPAVPMLLTRKKSAKHMRLGTRWLQNEYEDP